MYEDRIYERALQSKKDEEFQELKSEVKTVESLIEKFLTQILECTSSISERDFNACALQLGSMI